MTKEEAAELILMNATLYKQIMKPLTDEEMEATINEWTYQFKDYPGDVVKKAYLAARRVCVYPISVADIFKQLSKSLDPAVEWDAITAASHKAQRYLYWRSCPMIVGVDDNGQPIRSDGREELKELFDKLPTAAKVYIGSVGGLEELARTPDLTYRRVEFLKQSREEIDTAPKEAAQLRGGPEAARLEASHE